MRATLEKLGRRRAVAVPRAIELTSNPAEKTFLRGRLDELTARTDDEQ